jgi:hypothetical protein
MRCQQLGVHLPELSLRGGCLSVQRALQRMRKSVLRGEVSAERTKRRLVAQPFLHVP